MHHPGQLAQPEGGRGHRELGLRRGRRGGGQGRRGLRRRLPAQGQHAAEGRVDRGHRGEYQRPAGRPGDPVVHQQRQDRLDGEHDREPGHGQAAQCHVDGRHHDGGRADQSGEERRMQRVQPELVDRPQCVPVQRQQQQADRGDGLRGGDQPAPGQQPRHGQHEHGGEQQDGRPAHAGQHAAGHHAEHHRRHGEQQGAQDQQDVLYGRGGRLGPGSARRRRWRRSGPRPPAGPLAAGGLLPRWPGCGGGGAGGGGLGGLPGRLVRRWWCPSGAAARPRTPAQDAARLWRVAALLRVRQQHPLVLRRLHSRAEIFQLFLQADVLRAHLGDVPVQPGQLGQEGVVAAVRARRGLIGRPAARHAGRRRHWHLRRELPRSMPSRASITQPRHTGAANCRRSGGTPGRTRCRVS